MAKSGDIQPLQRVIADVSADYIAAVLPGISLIDGRGANSGRQAAHTASTPWSRTTLTRGRGASTAKCARKAVGRRRRLSTGIPARADIILTMQAIGDYAASEAIPAASAN